MSGNRRKSIIGSALNTVTERIEKSAALQRDIPTLKKIQDELQWMLEVEAEAPQEAQYHQPGALLVRLEDLDRHLAETQPPATSSEARAYMLTSGTVSSSDFIQYVYDVRNAYVKEPRVFAWAEKATEGYMRLRISEARVDMVRDRLGQLDPQLQVLFDRTLETSWIATAGVQSGVEAASLARELLVQFKGALIKKCRKGRGTRYQRIAENLAFDATVGMIKEEQDHYDVIHAELSEISKSRGVAPFSRLEELLAMLEAHILVVMIALDPEKADLGSVE